MRYHIDTIPLWDAAKRDGECLLCALERRTELGEAERYLGASVMEPDVRVRVNEKGFCRHHHVMLYGMSNRLGHALMLESHMIETRKRMAERAQALKKAAAALSAVTMGDRLTGKAKGYTEALLREARGIGEMAGSCVMCDTIRENMLRYYHTFFHLYQHDAEFRQKFKGSKGLCLLHMSELLQAAADELSPKELGAFVSELADCEAENLDRIQEDISWFIKKFDYRYEQDDWKNSKDAVERTVNKLRGWCVGREPAEDPNEKKR